MSGATLPDGRELIADGRAAVPDRGAEQFGEEGRLRAVHRGVEHQTPDDRQRDQAWLPAVEQREEDERPDADPDRAEQVDRSPPDAVGQGRPGGDRDQMHDGGDGQGVEGELSGELELLGDVHEDERRPDVVRDVLRDARAHGDQNLAPVAAQYLQDRRGLLRRLLRGPRLRGLLLRGPEDR
jgi:hypothetical protein